MSDFKQRDKFKPGDYAYIVMSDDKTHLPQPKKIRLTGYCDDDLGDGRVIPMDGFTWGDQYHTCNFELYRNRKAARKAARKELLKEAKHNAKTIQEYADRNSYIRYVLRNGLIK